jgi:hypothetical protein
MKFGKFIAGLRRGRRHQQRPVPARITQNEALVGWFRRYLTPAGDVAGTGVNAFTRLLEEVVRRSCCPACASGLPG